MMIGFPVLYGGHLTLMSPMAFIRRPQRRIRTSAAESRHGGVVTAAPNFASSWSPSAAFLEDFDDLDLSNVVSLNGSEPINIDSIASSTRRSRAYGLPSTAVKPPTGWPKRACSSRVPNRTPKQRSSILTARQLGAGRAARVAVAAPHARTRCLLRSDIPQPMGADRRPDIAAELPDGEVGDIWLHGNNIGGAYWARTRGARAGVRQQAAVATQRGQLFRMARRWAPLGSGPAI